MHKETPKHPVLSFVTKWSTLVILSLALAIIVIDTTVLNVSLRTIILDLNTNIQSLQWVITAYSLTLAALTITGGRLGDLYGRKKMFIYGAIIFAVGSFITSISKSVGIMLIGESIVEGIGAAMMMPATASLLVSQYKGRDRALAFGVWGGIAAASAAIGPILGGYLTTHYSWRWAFRINIFIVILLLIGSVVIKEARDREETAKLDVIGVILSAAGLFSLVFGIIESSSYGWYLAKQPFAIFGHPLLAEISLVPYSLCIGVVLLIAFGFWQNHLTSTDQTPLVNLKIFNNRQFTSGATTTAFITLGQIGLTFTLPIFLQAVRGLDALHTGFALLPMTMTLLIAAPLSGFISKYFKPKYIVQVGLILVILAIYIIYQSLAVTATAADLRLGLIIYGFGVGLVFAQVSNLTLSAVSVEEAGEASGVNNTFRQIGSTLGSAILGAVLLTTLATHLSHGINTSAIIPPDQKYNFVALSAKQTSNVEFGSGIHANESIPTNIANELYSLSKKATVDANKAALSYMALFIFIALIISTQLPKEPQLDHGESLASNVRH